VISLFRIFDRASIVLTVVWTKPWIKTANFLVHIYELIMDSSDYRSLWTYPFFGKRRWQIRNQIFVGVGLQNKVCTRFPPSSSKYWTASTIAEASGWNGLATNGIIFG